MNCERANRNASCNVRSAQLGFERQVNPHMKNLMKNKLLMLAVVVMIGSAGTASAQNSDAYYNVAAMITSDRLCGTAWTTDGRYDLEVKKLAFFNNQSEIAVIRITNGLSAKQIRDFQQSGNPLDKMCDQFWSIYSQ